MARTLFLVSGSLRTFQQNLQLYPSDCDIAVAASYREQDTYFNLMDVQFLFKDPRIKTVLFESEVDVPAVFKTERQRNMYKQWFKLHRLFSVVPSTYAVYVRIRPDVCLTVPGQLEAILETTTPSLRIPKHNDRTDVCGINDQVCIASYAGMKHYCDVIHHLTPADGSPADKLSEFLSEQVLAAHLTMPIERVVVDYKLVLSSAKVVAITGDSGSGKSTLLRLIRPLFLFDKVLEFETDRYHRWEREDSRWNTSSHLNPNSNHLEKLEEDTFNLRIGNSIVAVDYDHSTGTFTAPHRIEARDNVILCGLHTLYTENIRGLSDIKIYMDTDTDLTTEWKLRRDVGERGHTRESVLQKIRERADDFARYIRPQREFADMIIRYYTGGVELSVRKTFSVPDIAGCTLTQTDTFYKVTCTNPDISVESEVATFLRERRLPHIPPQSGYSGVIQLLILVMLYK